MIMENFSEFHINVKRVRVMIIIFESILTFYMYPQYRNIKMLMENVTRKSKAFTSIKVLRQNNSKPLE